MLNYNGDAARLDKGPAGSLWTYNLRHAKATLRYIMNGEGNETYHPRYTYFGFRYAELTATDDIDIAANVTGMIVGSDIEEWGTFSCSNPDINQLYSNVWWGQRGNFVSIPTDCPQRDERLGWTGDTQIFSTTALYNSDVKDFYRKWMRDMRNGQRDDGAYPCTAPAANMWGYGGSAWGDAGIIVPWTTYLMYGDKQVLRENFASMEKYMNWLTTQAADGFKFNGPTTRYGDWVSFVHTEARYISVCYYAYDADLMARMARALSTSENDAYAQKAAKYDKLAADIRAEWQTRFLNTTTGVPTEATQCAYLLALRFDMLPDATMKSRTVSALHNALTGNSHKLNTGFVGTSVLNQTLTDVGLTDDA